MYLPMERSTIYYDTLPNVTENLNGERCVNGLEKQGSQPIVERSVITELTDSFSTSKVKLSASTADEASPLPFHWG